MTLEETLLQRLADYGPQDSGRQTVTASDDEAGWSVSLSMDRNDNLGCALWEMSQRSRRPLSAAGLNLKTWAEKVAGQVRGLLEPLCVVEIDDTRDEALLRSDEPTARKSDRYYYEVLLKGSGQAAVRRFKGTTDRGMRQQIPFTLTHETVAKLAGDLAF
jgi:hypothetical protein